MSILQTVQQLAYKIFWGYAPKDGSKSLQVLCDFSAQTPFNIDLGQSAIENTLQFIQSIYIDNSLNAGAFTLQFTAPNTQKIVCPPFSQGYFPVACSTFPKIVASISSGTPQVPIEFYNVPYPAAVWSSNFTAIISGGSLGQDFSANEPALLAHLVATAPVNAARYNIEVQNQAAGTIQVELDDGTGANISIILLAPNAGGANAQGSSWNSQTFKGRVRVWATNTTDQVYMHQD